MRPANATLVDLHPNLSLYAHIASSNVSNCSIGRMCTTFAARAWALSFTNVSRSSISAGVSEKRQGLSPYRRDREALECDLLAALEFAPIDQDEYLGEAGGLCGQNPVVVKTSSRPAASSWQGGTDDIIPSAAMFSTSRSNLACGNSER